MKEMESLFASNNVFISEIVFEPSPESCPPRKSEISDSLKDFLNNLNFYFCSLFIRSTTSGVRFTFSSDLSKARRAWEFKSILIFFALINSLTTF